ncbi:DUF2254 family protein [Cellulosimicrobium protaetiae]|nr:DUF2254 family protein [Cellulosimicrobium protaetiae]
MLRARRRLRAGLAQLICAAAGAAAGLLLPRVDAGPTVDGSRLVEPMFTLGVGVIGVVSIVFSLLFGVVQWSASSFTPRLGLFRADPLVWRTFAFAIGVFVYCAVAALASADHLRVSVVVPGAAIVGVLAAVVLLRRLQTKAFLSLQLAHVLEAIVARGREVVADLYPPLDSALEQPRDAQHAQLPPRRRSVAWTGRSGVVQQLELRRLVSAATDSDVVVVFRIGVGDTLHEGATLADLHGGDLQDDVVRRAVVRGSERSFDQDPLLAFRLLADIGLRALSPAINDPATAVDTIDAVEGLLLAVARRDVEVGDVRDEAGALRARLVLPSWEDYLETSVSDLVPAASPFTMVLSRLLRLLDELLRVVAPDQRPALERLAADVRARLAAGR